MSVRTIWTFRCCTYKGSARQKSTVMLVISMVTFLLLFWLADKASAVSAMLLFVKAVTKHKSTDFAADLDRM